jgi:hypothetical protein
MHTADEERAKQWLVEVDQLLTDVRASPRSTRVIY